MFPSFIFIFLIKIIKKIEIVKFKNFEIYSDADVEFMLNTFSFFLKLIFIWTVK